MYMLCKVVKVNGTEMFTLLKSRLDLEELTEEVTKRVRDGCAIDKLHIFKNIEFEVACNVNYKEDA